MTMLSFTKEELQEIKRCLNYMINGGVTPYSNLTMNLKKKTQYLIDHIDRYQKPAEKFEEWSRQLS